MNIQSVLGRAAREREEKNNEMLAQMAAALGHPARVAISRLLRARGAMTCGALVAEIPLAQSTVSQHLKTMKDAGLLEIQAEGARVVYKLNDESLDALRELLTEL